MSRPELSAEEILAVLNRHHVDYLVIGAFAAITQGVPLEATHEVDVTTRRDADNLGRALGCVAANDRNSVSFRCSCVFFVLRWGSCLST